MKPDNTIEEAAGNGGRESADVADVRRAAFVDATLACLAEHGHHGTTVRRIAAAVGVAPGLLTHYFPGKDALVVEAYRTLAGRFLDHIDAETAAAGIDGLARLRAFIGASFRGPNLDAALLRIWINFWSLVVTEPAVNAVHAESYGAYRARVAVLVTHACGEAGRPVSEREAELLAIGLLALLDGLWLEWCLDPSNFKPEEGRMIALEMIGARLRLPLTDG